MRATIFYNQRAEDTLSTQKSLEKSSEGTKAAGASIKTEGKTEGQKQKNKVRQLRESLLMSKAELARKAGLSVLTIGRIEDGVNCRMDTKRKIILALGLALTDKDKVFPES